MGVQGHFPPIGAQVHRSTAQSIPASTFTTLIWQVEDYDDANFWDSASPTQFVIPRAGWYAVSCYLAFNGVTSGLHRLVATLKNGTFVADQGNIAPYGSTSTASPRIGMAIPVKCVAGDLITFQAYQDSSGALNTVVTPDPMVATIVSL